MALFQVTLPEIPNDVYIHDIAQTPSLLFAKRLLIAIFVIPAILGFITGFYLVFTHTSFDEKLMESLAYPIYIINFLSFIATFFAFFYLSKLSLRRRLLKLSIITLVLALIGACFDVFLSPSNVDIDSENIVLWLYMLYGCMAYPICLYLVWHIGKELSFILHSSYFFRSAKMLAIGFIVLLISLITVMSAYAAESEPALIVFALVMFGACIMMLIGAILWLVGIFKISQVVAYGENVGNPLS
ncbi:MAG: hypothetical protein J1E28_04600 [Helicobacter sp.]|uniref:hypothetical protein n=1 Tax=Helicobacter sp. TaxID=218 RepID=UPI0025C12EF1|nr:hypothetical protein [Helicobacter sp.]MCH5313653.1 hypothetical protein [Helicobacter sp.]